MLKLKTMPAATLNDSDLVSQSISGNRDAFSQIVERYQSLICSVAYSATGSLSQSEDLAQETFVTAWKKLRDLREPHKLRSWLCGIARNLTNSALRRDGREPVHDAEPLQTISESQSAEPLPVERAILKEEAEILWRSLERIPQTYREPLILFYREHQSAEKVAQALDLTEEAVHQRLSRGRKLLHEEVLAFVEGALEKTNPGKTFTQGVLATLPAASLATKAATVGATAATGGGVAKSAGIAGWLSALLGPFVVVLPNYVAYRIAMAEADSDFERYYIRLFYRKVILTILGLFIPYAGVIWWLTRNVSDKSLFVSLLLAGFVTILVPVMFLNGMAAMRQGRPYHRGKLERDYAGVFPKPAWEYRSSASFLGLPLVHIRAGDKFSMLREPVRAWIAVGEKAIGGLFAFGVVAVAPVSIGSFSFGAISIGGLSVGILSLGGIAFGIWSLFGGLVIGWQAVGACALAWDAASGGFAAAREFAVGNAAFAAEANTEAARQYLDSSLSFQWAHFINTHWYWLNLFWILPFFIQWLIASRTRRNQPPHA